MKKLLLGMAIALMTLTATLYAACTADVEMGGNQIKDLGNGTADGDAVNYEQTLKSSFYDIPENNVSIIASHSSYNVGIVKVGNICILTGLALNTSGDTLNSIVTFGTVPSHLRPDYQDARTAILGTSNRAIIIRRSNGNLELQFSNDANLTNNTHLSLNLSYSCN